MICINKINVSHPNIRLDFDKHWADIEMVQRNNIPTRSRVYRVTCRSSLSGYNCLIHLFHTMEVFVTDYRSIETHIKRARLERTVVLAELIATGIFALWSGATRLSATTLAAINALVVTPDEYSTALPHRF
ncbi:MAG: hypothetical protein ABI790_09685 [Betaproteobacteria bacterium]